MGKCLQSDIDRVRGLIAILGKQEWFDVLKASILPVVMQLPPEQQWAMTGVISNAWRFDRSGCLKLIEDNWLPDPSKDQLTWQVMNQLHELDERAVNMVCTLIRRADPGAMYLVESIAGAISESQPALAPRVFVEAVSRMHPIVEEESNA